MRQIVVEGLAIAVALTVSAVAQAQEAAPEATGTPPAEGAAPAEATTPAPAAPAAATPAPAAAGGEAKPAVQDGPRFRFGVAAGIGFFTAQSEVGSAKVSCTYYGGDLRLGMQINDLIGVYAQPTLGYYTADDTAYLAAGGLLGLSVVGDVTIIDHFFAGAGLGYTIYNNPSGLTPILRIGGYPLMAKSEDKARRKGLMLGVDLRFTSLEGLKTIVHPTFNVGYEAF